MAIGPAGLMSEVAGRLAPSGAWHAGQKPMEGAAVLLGACSGLGPAPRGRGSAVAVCWYPAARSHDGMRDVTC